MGGIHRSPVNSPHKGQWRGALMFSLICAWTNSWANNEDAVALIMTSLQWSEIAFQLYYINACKIITWALELHNISEDRGCKWGRCSTRQKFEVTVFKLTYRVIIKSLVYQNHLATSFWLNNDFVTPCFFCICDIDLHTTVASLAWAGLGGLISPQAD